MDETNKIILEDDFGEEHEMEIVLTFDDEANQKSFVLFTDPNDTEGNVYAYSYDEDGNMDEVTDPEEIEMCEEVLGAFLEEVQ